MAGAALRGLLREGGRRAWRRSRSVPAALGGMGRRGSAGAALAATAVLAALAALTSLGAGASPPAADWEELGSGAGGVAAEAVEAAAAWAVGELRGACDFCAPGERARHRGLTLVGVPRARARPMQLARGRLIRLELRLEEPGEPGLPTTREVVVFEEGAGSASGPPRYLGLSLQEPIFQE